jgi:hypothetical protein
MTRRLLTMALACCCASAAPLFAAPNVPDFNGDGKSDVIWTLKDAGWIYRMFMDGTTVTSGAMIHTESDPGWSVVAMGDFDGDGVTDLMWRHVFGDIYYMPIASDGTPSTGGTTAWSEGDPSWLIVQAPDLDGDGKSDLLWWKGSLGQVYAMLMDGAMVRAHGLVYTEPDTRWRIVGAGDFEGSGKQNQLLWRHAVTGDVYLMTVSTSEGTFSQSGGMIYREPDTAWKIIGVADFNGDGKSDILWRHDDTGQVYMMVMDGPAISAEGAVYAEPNVNWRIVAQGDYDGDGKADILWRNEATGEVYLMLMDGLEIVEGRTIYSEPGRWWKILGPRKFGEAMDAYDPTNCSASVPRFTYSGEERVVSIAKGDYASFRLGTVPAARAEVQVFGFRTVSTPQGLRSEMSISEACGNFDVDLRCKVAGSVQAGYVVGSTTDAKWCPLVPGRQYFLNVRHVVDGVDSCQADRCTQRLYYSATWQ